MKRWSSSIYRWLATERNLGRTRKKGWSLKAVHKDLRCLSASKVALLKNPAEMNLSQCLDELIFTYQ